MTPYVHFRHDQDSEEEYKVCQSILSTSDLLTDIPPGQRVICRYSALPFYREVEAEIRNIGSKMVHDWATHAYIARMDWAFSDMSDLTFPTWDGYQNLPDSEHGYVVKGRTNSRKFDWNRRMYAPTKEDIPRIVNHLMDDALIADQGIIVRQYVPLRKFDEGINGLPVTNEWRLFFLDGQFLTGAYYWSIHEPSFDPRVVPSDALDLAKYALERSPSLDHAFVVVDVAEDKEGRWWGVELNDGQMSGLSYNDPKVLYNKIREMTCK